MSDGTTSEVFTVQHWNSENHYTLESAVRTFKRRHAANRFAEQHGLVVRTFRISDTTGQS